MALLGDHSLKAMTRGHQLVTPPLHRVEIAKAQHDMGDVDDHYPKMITRSSVKRVADVCFMRLIASQNGGAIPAEAYDGTSRQGNSVWGGRLGV